MLKIKNPSITNIVAVRANNQVSNHRVALYIGYNQNEFKSKRNKRFHLAKILALHAKDTYRVEYTTPTIVFASAGHLSTDEVSREICKYLKVSRVYDWKSDVFQEAIRKLLGKGWTSSKGRLYPNSARDKTIYRHDEAVFSNGTFYSTKVYWTQNENKLKGIIYRH